MPNTGHIASRFETGLSLRLFGKKGLVILWQLATTLSAAHAYGQSHEWVTPGELVTTDSKAFLQWLETARPAPLTAQARAHVLSVLPPEGEITRLNGSGRRKVAAVGRLLQVMGRDLTHEIKVVEAPILRVGVYERTVILITETALTLLEAEELQALAAHEIGHEYFTAQYERASELKDKQRLKELELMCDAVALVTLERLHIDPSRLMSAVEKVTRYNRQHFGDAVDESGYPTLSQRGTFARQVIEWFARGR
jgi:hypothetical protein